MAGFSIQGMLLLELEAGLAADEVGGKMEREEKGDERSSEGDPVGEFGAVGQERDEDCACERDQQDEGENGLVDIASFSVACLSVVNHGDVTYFVDGFGMKEGKAPRVGRAGEQQE